MDTAFTLTVTLKTPVALGSRTYWTLDGICFGILDDMQRTGLTKLDPLANIPLASHDGLYFATAARIDGAHVSDLVKIGGIRPVRDMADATRFLRPVRGTKLPMVRTASGPEKNHLSRYQTISASQISWSALGDPDKVMALVKNAGALGALRKDGHGRIETVEIEELPEIKDGSAILLDADNHVTRPVPSRMVADLGINPASAVTVETWQPPYWIAENRDECFVPPAPH